MTRIAEPGNGYLNLNVLVREWGDEVIFLRRVEEGAADRSYGIEVARLAGVPEPVVRRASEILRDLERKGAHVIEVHPGEHVPAASPQLSLFGSGRGTGSWPNSARSTPIGSRPSMPWSAFTAGSRALTRTAHRRRVKAR